MVILLIHVFTNYNRKNINDLDNFSYIYMSNIYETLIEYNVKIHDNAKINQYEILNLFIVIVYIRYPRI